VPFTECYYYLSGNNFENNAVKFQSTLFLFFLMNVKTMKTLILFSALILAVTYLECVTPFEDVGDSNPEIYPFTRQKRDTTCWSNGFGCHDGGCNRNGGMCGGIVVRKRRICRCTYPGKK